jgi:hypothetical protein
MAHMKPEAEAEAESVNIYTTARMKLCWRANTVGSCQEVTVIIHQIK